MYGQTDSTYSKVSFEMDFRFRAEHDWESRKADGTFRADRSRLRYRFRTGAIYSHERFSFGSRIRTGDQRKQQDPQLTLGKGWKEFGTLPLGFEKIYFQYNGGSLNFWLGKNTFPFKKNNELFWSDNVFPEGVAIEKRITFKNEVFKQMHVIGGHCILGSNDGSFFDDAYLQGIQSTVIAAQNKYEISSAFYLFRNIPNIPDGSHTYLLNYSIFHLRSKLKINNYIVTLDYYNNLENYNEEVDIPGRFKKQNQGFTFGIQYGALSTEKKWKYSLAFAYLERFALLDYMAQNDWARWDYSSSNSPDGRLSNYKGLEAAIAYSISENINLVAKYYSVQQLLPMHIEKENGQRIRFDINVKM